MTKLKWDRHRKGSVFYNDYWLSPRHGFDKKWHEKIRNKKKKNINLGIHENHNWHVIKEQIGPHAGKIICKDCNNKLITWLPKGII